MNPSITIVVPCRNEAVAIRAFLDSLLAQDLDGIEWEVIVADGMSDDGTRAILDEYCQEQPRVRVIDNPGRIVSTGLNAAIAAARGEVILRMDAHTVYEGDYVRQCVGTLRKTGADNVGGPWIARGEAYIARAIAAAFQSRFSAGAATSHDASYEGLVNTVYLGCWRKQTLSKLGPFDETLVRNQDDELNLRLIRAGGIVWQSPRIRSWYKPRNSLSALFRQYFQYGFWKVAVIRKHRLPASWRHLVPGTFVLVNVLLLLTAFLSWTLGARSVAKDAGWAWASQAVAYGVLLLAASIATAEKRGWGLLPILPFVFVVYHVSYGVGFLAGMAHFLLGRPLAARQGTLFTEVTR